MSNAVGMAFAEKYRKSRNVVRFYRDGLLGRALCMNPDESGLILQVPLLIVVENNRYAQTTALEDNFAGSFEGRVRAFDLSYGEVESNDVSVLYPRFEELVSEVRTRMRPCRSGAYLPSRSA